MNVAHSSHKRHSAKLFTHHYLETNMKQLSSALNPSKLNKTLRTSAFALFASVLIGFQGSASAQTVDESKYKPVREEITVTSGSKIEVAELFWFGCSHCFALEPALKEWQKKRT